MHLITRFLNDYLSAFPSNFLLLINLATPSIASLQFPYITLEFNMSAIPPQKMRNETLFLKCNEFLQQVLLLLRPISGRKCSTTGQRAARPKAPPFAGTVIVGPDTSSVLLYILYTSVAVFFNNSSNFIYPEQGFLCS